MENLLKLEPFKCQVYNMLYNSKAILMLLLRYKYFKEYF